MRGRSKREEEVRKRGEEWTDEQEMRDKEGTGGGRNGRGGGWRNWN